MATLRQIVGKAVEVKTAFDAVSTAQLARDSAAQHLALAEAALAHRIVAAAYLPKPFLDRWDVNHKNGVKTDNRVDNLECITRSENILHAMKHFPRKHTSLRGTMVRNAKLDETKVKEIKHRLANGEKQTTVAADYGVCKQVIWSIASGKWWKWVDIHGA